MIFGSRRRIHRRSAPLVRGLGALGRAIGLAWRRSLQLRVVSLTLGLSLAVILVLGFVLTSQITDRILEVKVGAATEEIERARTTVSGIVGGEETRSLDSSLQLARNTLIDRKADAGAGLAGAFDAVLIVAGDGPRAATAAGPIDQIPNTLRDFVKAGQVSYQYATVHTDGFSGPALIVGSPTPATSSVTNLELYLIFPLNNEESTITLVRGTMATGGVVLLVVLLGAGPLAAQIPTALLAGILIKVGLDIIDWGFLLRAHRLSAKTAALMYAVLLMTVFWDLIWGVLVGMFVANLLTVDAITRSQLEGMEEDNPADARDVVHH